jgi:hypothetical protein
MIIQRSVENAKSPKRMAALINSLASLNEIIDDEVFGEFDNLSTIKSTPRNSLRSNID